MHPLRRFSLICSVPRVVFWKGDEKYKRDLLLSQFHLSGHRHFQKSREMIRNLNNNITDIEKLQGDLLRLRALLSESRNFATAENAVVLEDERYRVYFESYLKLIEAMKVSKFDEEWFYHIAGWYNIQSLLRDLFEQLFTSKIKLQHSVLIQALAWMNPHSYTPLRSTDIREVTRQAKLAEDYYKRLNIGHSISFLRQIESIFGLVQNSYKSKYYSKYMNANLPKILKKLATGSQQQLDDAFWLVKVYFQAYNDKPEIIDSFEQFLLKNKVNLSQYHLQILINIYNRIGSINKQIYSTFLKPYLLLLENHSSIQILVKHLQFVINSQANDEEVINLLLSKMATFSKTYEIEDYFKNRIHYLQHYMNIKGIKYEISIKFGKELSECCRKNEGNGSVGRMMVIQLDQKGRQQGKSYFISDCLRRGRLNSSIKQDIGIQVPKLPEFKKYNNVRFCTIEIKNCVVNEVAKESVVLQRVYRRLEHSGKLTREQRVRDTILSHYGFKLNYMELKDEFKTETNIKGLQI